MEDISQLNLLMATMKGAGGGQRKTPGDVGESLFRDFLTVGSRQHSGENNGLSIAGRKRTESRFSRDQEDTSTPLDALDEKFRYLGSSMEQLRLPGRISEQLARFLEKRGFSREDIDRLILSATDEDGMIRVGRLMTQLQKGGPENGQSGGNLLVKSGDVPEVESMLMKMGFDIGKVKEMIEKSVDAKGDLVLSRMTDDLAKFMSGKMSEEQLATLLERHGIESRVQGIQGVFQDPDLQAILKGFSEAPSQDIQQKIKQDIAQLLREKGIPPQEVKSFLENLSVKYSGSLLKTEDQAVNAARTAVTEREAANLLNQVVITTRKGWETGGVHEKIMDILRQENLIGKNDKGLFREETSSFRLNMVELMKAGDQKVKISDLQTIMSQHGNGSPEMKTARGKATGQPAGDRQDMRPFLDMKDASGNDIHSTRAVKEHSEVTSSNYAKNTNTLPHPLPKIVDRMVWMIRGGEQKGSIHISPPELGKLDLDLVIKQGHLHANLIAENPAVKEIIEGNLNQLKQQLAAQGFIVDKFEVMVGQEERRFRNGDSRTAGDRRSRGSKKSGIDLETASVAGVGRNPGYNLSQIDVHV